MAAWPILRCMNPPLPRYMDAKSLAELAPRLAALVRRGVGLATRAGAGRFISQVARRLGSDIQPSAPQLMKSLVEGCKGDRSGAVKRSFAAANACVARYAASPRVAKLVGDCLEMYGAEDADDNARLVAGLLLRELGKEAGDVFAQHAGALAPQAYLAQCDGSADVASMWQEVWEECATSAGAGLRVHVQEIAQLITCGLQSGQWGRKKGAALALDRACTAAPDAVQPLATALMESLLKELPGRLWDGKEAVLVAVGALATACPSQILGISSGNPAADSTDPTAPPGSLGSRVVAALVEAGGKVKSGYRLAALEQLERVLKASAKGGSGDGRDFFALASPLLLDLCSKFVPAWLLHGALPAWAQPDATSARWARAWRTCWAPLPGHPISWRLRRLQPALRSTADSWCGLVALLPQAGRQPPRHCWALTWQQHGGC